MDFLILTCHKPWHLKLKSFIYSYTIYTFCWRKQTGFLMDEKWQVCCKWSFINFPFDHMTIMCMKKYANTVSRRSVNKFFWSQMMSNLCLHYCPCISLFTIQGMKPANSNTSHTTFGCDPDLPLMDWILQQHQTQFSKLSLIFLVIGNCIFCFVPTIGDKRGYKGPWSLPQERKW